MTFRRRGPTTLYWSIPLMLVAAIAQSTLFRHLDLFGAVPNLVLAISVAWTLLRGTHEGLLWAFTGGLALDLLSGGRWASRHCARARVRARAAHRRTRQPRARLPRGGGAATLLNVITCWAWRSAGTPSTRSRTGTTRARRHAAQHAHQRADP
jgi:rod shape-determining protein MreD